MRRILMTGLAAGTMAFALGCHGESAPTTGQAKPDSKANVTETKPETKPEVKPEVKPEKKEARLEQKWDGKLHYQENTKPSHCDLMGRVRLFITDFEHPQAADGKLTINLYDETPKTEVIEPFILDSWTFDEGVLKLFLAKNADDPEYELVCPWPSYKREMTQIRLEAVYLPKEGKPLTAKTEIIKLDHSEMKEHEKK